MINTKECISHSQWIVNHCWLLTLVLSVITSRTLYVHLKSGINTQKKCISNMREFQFDWFLWRLVQKPKKCRWRSAIVPNTYDFCVCVSAKWRPYEGLVVTVKSGAHSFTCCFYTVRLSVSVFLVIFFNLHKKLMRKICSNCSFNNKYSIAH